MTNLPVEHKSAKRARQNVAAVGAAAAAAGAVACGVCCVLPFALPAAALAGSGGLLAWFGGAQVWATISSAALVLAAWLWVLVRSIQTRRPPSRATLIVLGEATMLFGAAAARPAIEGALVQALDRGH